jgi:hypothetical protein
MNVISANYRLSDNVTVQITMRSNRVLTAREVRMFGVLAEAAEKVGAEQANALEVPE